MEKGKEGTNVESGIRMCPKCGRQIDFTAVGCRYCGYMTEESEKSKRYASYGFICGLLGLLFFPLGFILGPLALYYGNKARKHGTYGGWGQVLGCLLTIVWVGIILFVIVAVACY